MNILLSTAAATRRMLPSAAILVLIALLVYANISDAPFVFDDRLNITQNTHIRMTAVTCDSILDVLNSPVPTRPMANLTLALNYYLHGYDVRGYHAVNLLIHVVTALLMFLVARQTLRLCGAGNTPAPLMAAALWLVNPVHTQSVTYTIQRMNSLAAMFFMMSLFLYIRARTADRTGRGLIRRVPLYVFSLAAGLAGLTSKEIVAVLPVILFLYEWYFFQNRDPFWLKRRLRWIGLAAVACLLPAAVLLGTSPVDQILKDYQKHDFTPVQRLLTEPAVVLYYISLLFFPHPDRLILLYDFPVSASCFKPLTTATAFMGLIALALCGLRLSARHRLLSFSVFWFLITLVIESSVLGLAIAYEHRTYLPSIFPFIALTALVTAPSRTRNIAVAILCLLIAVCGLWTWQRNSAWNDAVLLWRDNVAKAPDVAEAGNNLGQALLAAGDTEQAVSSFNTALAKDPSLDSARVNLGVALMRLGRPDQAIDLFRTALENNPLNIQARYNLAGLLKELGRPDDAIAQLRQIIALDPVCVEALLNLGGLLLDRGQEKEALEWLEKAAALNPGDPGISNNLGIALHRLDRMDEAIDILKHGLSQNPDHPGLHNSLGLVLLDRNRYEDASREFQMALAAAPMMPEAHNNLGLAAERQGDIIQAVGHYRQALELAPTYHLARYNLASLFLKTGQSDKVIPLIEESTDLKREDGAMLRHLLMDLIDAQKLEEAAILAEKMAAAEPDNPMIHYNLACLYARMNNPGNAIDHLRRAVSLGYDHWDHLRADPDLNNIRNSDYFKTLMPLLPAEPGI
ncbi:MAG: tetratricopeptide repeat protein [Thermodesulfobacteriota bacterium]